jgi:hypothetical protein
MFRKFHVFLKLNFGALVKSGENANDDSRVYIVCAQDSENEFLSKCRPGARIKNAVGKKEISMAEHTSSSPAKTLEMRVAELEDKLSKIHVTEDEMKAYHKVSSLVGQQAAPSLTPQICVISRCITANCISTVCIQPSCIRQNCIYECTCGPCSCILQSKGPGGGDFGGFGS